MKNLTYKEFLMLVAEAAGPFGYRFDNRTMICAPNVYIAMHWPGRAWPGGGLWGGDGSGRALTTWK